MSFVQKPSYLHIVRKSVITVVFGLILQLSFLIDVKAQISAASKATNIGRIGLSINNYGTIGRPTVRSNTQGPPSMSFPRGSGVEHLFEAGIWIGARVDGQIRVTTSSVDASAGYSTGASGFECTQTSGISERSKLPSSSSFSSSAISHQDLITNFTDSFTVVPGTSIPINGHNPLGAVVHLETYAWNFSFADFFVIANYEITNKSDNRWDSVWLGSFSDMIVRNVNVTRDAGTAFFNKGRNGIDRKFNSFFAYESYGDDIDFTRSYGAAQFLGIDWRGMFFNPAKPDTFLKLGLPKPVVNFNFWNFNSVNSPWITPSNDLERYLKLSSDIDSATLYSSLGPVVGVPGNWMQLMSAGPIVSVNPGEKFTYTIAFVCAKQKEPTTYLPTNSTYIYSTPDSRKELTDNFKRVRSTYLGEDINEEGIYKEELDLNQNGKLDRYILPEPPVSPNSKLIATNNKVEIYWDNQSEYSIDPISRKRDFEGYRIYRSNPGDDLKLNILDAKNLVAQWDSIGNEIGFNNGFESIKLPTPVKFDGDTTTYHYKYEMSNLSNGWQYLFVITAFDRGDKNLNIESLESSYSENEFRVYSGTPINDFEAKDARKVGVYPNPYNTNAAWDGNSSRTRKIYFYNLPNRCEITIYTSSGDVIATLAHDGKNYTGEDIRWFKNYSNVERTITSGGEHAWDLLTNYKTEIQQGIYLFTVKDLQSDIIETGKFAVIK